VQGERRRGGVALFAGLAAVVIAASGAAVALGAKGDLHLVSRQSDADGGAGADSRSFGASLSDRGRLVAFTSEATNLGSIDGNATVYVYNFANRSIEIVSRQSADAGGLPADGFSVAAEISGNGRFVVFRTDATNLGGPIVANENIYVYDRREDRVQLVSRRSKAAGGAGANDDADSPSISANGRYVSYQTQATNLGGPIVGEGEANVYVYDRKQNRTFLVSRRSHGGRGGNGNSFETSLAPAAPVAVFESQATNLGGPTNPNASANVYAYDWKRRKLELAARRSGNGKGPNSAADMPDVSASGRLVLFETDATNLGGPLRGPEGTRRLYLHDRKTGRTSLVSRQSKAAGGKGADANAGNGELSNTGRFVAFDTAATNLGGPIASSLNVYVYDRERRRVTLASRADDGGPGADDYAGEPALAGNGWFVAFYTPAMNIDPPGEPAYHGNIPPNTNVYRFQVR
jgi:Tol biopolymer transport system component